MEFLVQESSYNKEQKQKMMKCTSLNKYIGDNFNGWAKQSFLKGADQGFLIQSRCPTVENSSPLMTLAEAFCVYSLGIGPEQRTEPISIKIFHQGSRPQPHFASMVTVQKQLSRNKKGQWLRVDRVQRVEARPQHLFACAAYDSLIIHEELVQ